MVKLGPTIIEQVSKLCAGSGVARLDLTGSAVRDDFDPSTSDIDLLVEFELGTTVGFRAFRVEEQLSVVFGDRKIDVLTSAREIHAA